MASLEAAALAGEASRHDAIVAKARVKLVYTVGFQLADKGARTREVPRADASVRRIGDPAEDRARLLSHQAAMEAVLDDQKKALELRRAGLARAEAGLGSDHPLSAILLGGIGSNLHVLGHDDEALQNQERAIAIQERLYGKVHPAVATNVMNMGTTLRALGRLDEALVAERRALTIREQVFGPDSADAAMALNNLGNLYEDMGRYQDAADVTVRALGIYRKNGMEKHPYNAISEGNLGNLLMDLDRRDEALLHHRRAVSLFQGQGDLDNVAGAKVRVWVASDLVRLGREREAQPEFEEAIRSLERKLGQYHPEIAFAHYQYAGALKERGDLKQALALQRRALEVREKMPSPSPLHLGISHAAIADVLLDLHQPRGALEELEKAGPLIEPAPGAAADLGAYRFIRARTLAALGRQEEGLASARGALDAVAQLPADADRFRAQVRDWLASQGGTR